MRRLVLALSILIAALAAPAAAQPVYVASAGSNETGTPGVTARPVEAIRPPVAASGTANFRIQTQDGKCLVPQMDAGKIYLLRPGNCADAVVFNVKSYGDQRVRFELDRSGTCLVFSQRTFDGTGTMYRSWGQGLSPAPCSETLEQRFRVDWSRAPGLVSIREAGGQCWSNAETGIKQFPCEDRDFLRFRLTPVTPPGYVAPANPGGPGNPYPGQTNGRPGPVATPVGGATTTPGSGGFVPVRPAGLPDNWAAPAEYFLTAGRARDNNDCYAPIGGGAGFTLRLDPRGCRDVPESTVTLRYTGSRGFQLTVFQPGACFTTAGRPWITVVNCSPVAEQIFQVVQADFVGFYVIKTQAGLCLTQRGAINDDPAQNNSALFPEPCREAPEQYFKLRPLRQ